MSAAPESFVVRSQARQRDTGEQNSVSNSASNGGSLRLWALGGLGEVGMNCLVMEAEQRLLVIDCGLTFPDREPGVELIHPDFEMLLERQRDLLAIVVTHGHEDHVGAIPYLLRDIDRPIPVYGPPYA